jgi:hypothetical protein
VTGLERECYEGGPRMRDWTCRGDVESSAAQGSRWFDAGGLRGPVLATGSLSGIFMLSSSSRSALGTALGEVIQFTGPTRTRFGGARRSSTRHRLVRIMRITPSWMVRLRVVFRLRHRRG